MQAQVSGREFRYWILRVAPIPCKGRSLHLKGSPYPKTARGGVALTTGLIGLG